MRVAILVFPGSNCDRDMMVAVEAITGRRPALVWHKDSQIDPVDLIIVPGGFSFGDYLRCGALAARAPAVEAMLDHASRGGAVLGVCNGFQILCETGLLPGALLHNNNQKFICKNVFLKPESASTLLTRGLDADTAYKIPIAHGEGRYFASPKVIEELNDKDQVLFRYCDDSGQVSDSVNPNGSVDNIAGICNSGRNIFGMMPHPERAADVELGNTDGKLLFDSILGLVNA